MADRAKLVAALDYLSRIDETMKNLQSGAKQFGAGVIDNLTGRAKDLGGLIYEAGTSDPNMGRMTTAEFSQAAAQRPQTPNLDQMWGDLGTMGKAIVTQPIQTGKAIVQGEVERAKEATSDPRAAGNYAGSFIDPMKLAKMLKGIPSMRELDVHHGTPHRFPPTEANPLGEFDASKIGTGEGAQAYGHGIYLAESPEVAQGYRKDLSKNVSVDGQKLQSIPSDSPLASAHNMVVTNIQKGMNPVDAIAATAKYWKNAAEEMQSFAKTNPKLANRINKEVESRLQIAETAKTLKPESFYLDPGSLYKADLPDEMIDRMLDWDKPLSEQPAAVQAALRTDPRIDKLFKSGKIDSMYQNGGEYYRALSGKFSQDKPLHLSIEDAENLSQKNASQFLNQAGIPGIKYLDAGSRTAQGSGTRNFVVFPGEEKKVKILERK